MANTEAGTNIRVHAESCLGCENVRVDCFHCGKLACAKHVYPISNATCAFGESIATSVMMGIEAENLNQSMYVATVPYRDHLVT